MKLVGEYELTETGVSIEGQIKGSKIADVRKMLKGFQTFRIFKGDSNLEDSKSTYYQVPHTYYRSYIRKNLPDLLTPETEKDYIKFPKTMAYINQASFNMYYNDFSTIANNMGVLYGDCEGKDIMRQISYIDLHKFASRRIGLCTNSAWVWTADESGNFKIDLNGLVNRHIMTVLLSNATKLAKYIDEVLVRVLDHEDKFTEEAIQESQGKKKLQSAMRPGTVSPIRTA